MSSKAIIITSKVDGASSDNPSHPNAISAGDKWVISAFGAADINLGDSKSTVYVLRFGDKILKIISVTGSTINIPMKLELTGDGLKVINVRRQNNSGHRKTCPFWIEAYKRS